MKTINKFSLVLLLLMVVLLSSYALIHKEQTEVAKVVTTANVVEKHIETNEAATKMRTDIKIRKASCACGQLTVTTKGPDPERRSLCHCHLCQKQTGSWFSVQARFPKEEVTIIGKSTVWKYPPKDGKTVTGRTCSDAGGTFHFCPVCGSTVYYTVDADSTKIGVKVGAFADPTFPAPNIAGFEEYKFPYAMNLQDLQMEHHN